MDQDHFILFICHESSRTGAPLSLLYLLRWIKKNTDQKFIVLIEKGGELEPFFSELGTTLVIRPERPSLFMKFLHKLVYRRYVRMRLKSIWERPIGLIYLNTFSNGSLACSLKEHYNCRLLTHVHELEGVIRSAGRKNSSILERITDHYIAASGSVRDNLILNHAIPGNRITVHYECIEPSGAGNNFKANKQKTRDDDFLVGGAGFVDYRKGFDLFLETARILTREKGVRGIRFIWVGEFGRNRQKVVNDFITAHGLNETVRFRGKMEDPMPLFRLFDLFFLSSREDPYPLVMLENAWLGTPVIGFSGSGGLEEFLDHDQELLAGAGDAEGAAGIILNMMKHRDEARRIGAKLKKKVEENHLMNICGQKYYDRIISLGKNRERTSKNR